MVPLTAILSRLRQDYHKNENAGLQIPCTKSMAKRQGRNSRRGDTWKEERKGGGNRNKLFFNKTRLLR